MRKFRIHLVSLMFSFLFVTGCGSDDSEDIIEDLNDDMDNVDPGTPGSITAKINGEDFSISGIFVTADLSDQSNGYLLAIGGLKWVNETYYGMTLAMISSDFSTLDVGDTFSGGNSEMFFAGGYSVEIDDEIEIQSSSELVSSASCTITKIDRENNLISGTFSFDAIDDSAEKTYEVREGVFTDIEYY